jgi:hypothetical protein
MAIPKLTEEQVYEIRRKYRRGSVGYGTLAAKYGVSKAAIAQAVQRKTWKQVR